MGFGSLIWSIIGEILGLVLIYQILDQINAPTSLFTLFWFSVGYIVLNEIKTTIYIAKSSE